MLKHKDNSFRWLCLGIFCLSMAWHSCTDTWNDHYATGGNYEVSLWEAIGQRDELSNFAKVVLAAGYDSRLGSSQTFTVFAPTNQQFTADEADRLVVRYQEQKQRGVKDDDNTVVRQFLQNHIALYNYSIAPSSERQITMMNGKRQMLTDKNFGNTRIIDSNCYCTNGVLFVVDQSETYFSNIYEAMAASGITDRAYQFLNSYSIYQFDAEKSVAGDIVDGKTVYLDSVFHLTNSILSEYGHINREDSSYIALVPDDQEWDRLYQEYVGFFNYNNTTLKRDSMIAAHTNRAIADGTIFNLNLQKSLQDSAVSTLYQRLYRKTNYTDPRYYVYQRPYDEAGAFAQATEVKCSNGQLLIQHDWKIDCHETFLQQIKVEAEQTRYVDTIIQAHEPLTVRAVPLSSPFYHTISEHYFAEAQPLTSASSTTVRYRMPDQLSATGYDIYAIFVPAIAYDENASADDRLPCRVRMTLSYLDQEGNEVTSSLRNPADNSVNFVTQPDVIDSVLVASDYVFPTCALGLNDPQVTLRIASNVSASQSSRYTRVLRLDCLLLKPHVNP